MIVQRSGDGHSPLGGDGDRMNAIERIELATDKLAARREGPIGWIVFDNPARRNALSLEMWRALADVAGLYARDDATRVAIMTGAGCKAFVSGADISEFGKHRSSADAEREYNRVSAAAHEALAGFGKPLIAMIRGYCIGGGLSVALQADIRIAADDAQFAIPAARLGLGYGFGGMRALVAQVGPAAAREIMFTARRFGAEEALRIGLVNRVVAARDLEAEVRACADSIAANAPLTVRAAKAAIGEALKDPADRDLARIERMIRACFDSADYAEGRRAFMEKRAPRFTGR